MNLTKKRLISAINIFDKIAVQSKSFKDYLPIGSPEILVENLSRWNSDEILLQFFNRSKKKLGPNFELLKKITNFKNGTPLIYSGGIRNCFDALEIIKNGADRVMVGYSFFNKLDYNNLSKISDKIGKQSLILSLPLKIINNNFYIYNYVDQISIDLKKINFSKLENIVSEILITDAYNEGNNDNFDIRLLKLTNIIKVPLIFFGGIFSKNKVKKILSNKNVSAVGIGNSLNFKEHAYQSFVLQNKNFFRKVNYAKKR